MKIVMDNIMHVLFTPIKQPDKGNKDTHVACNMVCENYIWKKKCCQDCQNKHLPEMFLFWQTFFFTWKCVNMVKESEIAVRTNSLFCWSLEIGFPSSPFSCSAIPRFPSPANWPWCSQLGGFIWMLGTYMVPGKSDKAPFLMLSVDINRVTGGAWEDWQSQCLSHCGGRGSQSLHFNPWQWPPVNQTIVISLFFLSGSEIEPQLCNSGFRDLSIFGEPQVVKTCGQDIVRAESDLTFQFG